MAGPGPPAGGPDPGPPAGGPGRPRLAATRQRDRALVPVARHQLLADVRRQRLDRLAHRDAGGAVHAGGEPLGHERGAPPGRIAQDAADLLADEELLLLQHAVRIPAEPGEVTVPAAERAEQGEQRGAA